MGGQMTDEPIKKRLCRAIAAATRILDNPQGSAAIIFLKNSPFHIEYIRYKEIRKIRITLDTITNEDVKLVKNFPLPASTCTKEIWCRKGNQFIYREIS
jgi:hypothetical protein